MSQIPSQPQGVPPAATPGAPASQPGAQAAATPGAPIGAQPQTTPPSAPTTVDAEQLRQQYQAAQEQIKRLQGTQAAKDRQLYEMQMRSQQEKQAIQAELERNRIAQLPQEQQEQMAVQTLQERLAQSEQARQELEWSRYLQSVAMDLTATKGVPYETLMDAARQAGRPDEAYHFMNQAALNYLYSKLQGGQPQPMPTQPAQPQYQPPTQQYQPQQAPTAPPHPTQYAQGTVPSSTDEDFRALQDKTKTTGKSTVEEGLAVLQRKWREAGQQ